MGAVWCEVGPGGLDVGGPSGGDYAPAQVGEGVAALGEGDRPPAVGAGEGPYDRLAAHPDRGPCRFQGGRVEHVQQAWVAFGDDEQAVVGVVDAGQVGAGDVALGQQVAGVSVPDTDVAVGPGCCQGLAVGAPGDGAEGL